MEAIREKEVMPTVREIQEALGNDQSPPRFAFRESKESQYTKAADGTTFYVINPPPMVSNSEIPCTLLKPKFLGISLRYRPDNMSGLIELCRSFLTFLMNHENRFRTNLDAANLKSIADLQVKVEGENLFKLMNEPGSTCFTNISYAIAKKQQLSRNYIFGIEGSVKDESGNEIKSGDSTRKGFNPIDVNTLYTADGKSDCKYTSGVIVAGSYNYCRLSWKQRCIYISSTDIRQIRFSNNNVVVSGGTTWVVNDLQNTTSYPPQNNPQYGYASNHQYTPPQQYHQYVPPPSNANQYVPPNQYTQQPSNANQYVPPPSNANQYTQQTSQHVQPSTSQYVPPSNTNQYVPPSQYAQGVSNTNQYVQPLSSQYVPPTNHVASPPQYPPQYNIK